MTGSFKGRTVAPPVERRTDLAFAAGMNQAAPGVPAGAKQYAPVTKSAAQGSLQHKRAHMHKDKARQR